MIYRREEGLGIVHVVDAVDEEFCITSEVGACAVRSNNKFEQVTGV